MKIKSNFLSKLRLYFAIHTTKHEILIKILKSWTCFDSKSAKREILIKIVKNECMGTDLN